MSLKEYDSNGGGALPDADPTGYVPGSTPLDVVRSEFQILPLAAIVASLTNPRKHFDPAALAELAESIKTSGVHQPVIVRPLPGDRVLETGRAVRFELVAGERRLRASVLAGVPTIPALVRTLTDDQVLELQIVENLQRADLSELEEAEGYAALMQHNGISADQVGTKIGKSRSHVYGRLKLLDLCQECKEALRAGQIDASRALLIARIPDGKLQQKALAEATRENPYNKDVCSVRELASWLQQNVMLRLESAPFGITEVRLIEGAGSCKECPKRTGANPDLFAEVNSADLCTDPTCYARKCEAHRGQMEAKAQAKGMVFVDGKEARGIIKYNGAQLNGYTSLAQVREDVANPAKGTRAPTLRELLGKDAPAPVLIEHPWTKELIEAVPTAEAEAMLLARGLIADTAKATKARRDIADEIEDLQKDAARAIGIEYRQNALAALRAAVLATPPKQAPALLTKALLSAWLVELSEELATDDVTAMFDVEFDDNASGQEAMRLHIESSDTATLMRALVIYMVLEDGHYPRWGDADAVPPPKMFEGLAPAVKVDLAALQLAAKAKVRAGVAEKVRALKTEQKMQEANALVPLSPAAQAQTTGGGQAKPNAKAKKPKLSAAQAQASIAAALQESESESKPGAAVAAQGIEGPVADALAVGARVRVTDDIDKLPTTLYKWAGKEGTITRANLDDLPDYWVAGVDVTFKGRHGGVACFNSQWLEVVNPGINPAAAPVPLKAWPFPPLSKTGT